MHWIVAGFLVILIFGVRLVLTIIGLDEDTIRTVLLILGMVCLIVVPWYMVSREPGATD